jgi:peptidase E
VRRIVPLGGGGLSDPALLGQILEMTGKDRPRICYVPTASGDPVEAIEQFHAVIPSDRAVATDLALFRMDGRDPREVLLAQDVIYVGGGSTANMLAVWRVHGVDRVMAEAWERGIVLTGASAGAICWFEDGVTDSFGPSLDALGDGLGFLPGSFCPHWDSEELRKPVYHELVDSGRLVPGIAADDYAGPVFEGTELIGVVRSRPGAGVYRVAPGGVTEEITTP